MKQLKTFQDLLDNVGKRVKYTYNGKDAEGIIVKHSYCFVFIDNNLIRKNSFDNGDSNAKDVFLLEEEKKPSRIKHTYTTTFTRDDGVQFTKDSIDGVSIDSLKEQEQKHYEEARAIRAKLNAHSKLKF